jgi:uncharacterized protein YdeI (YjbR/CyaY-like superfamily)
MRAMARDKRIDASIAKSADFARPILRYLRETVHEGCPQVEETLKWGFPHFLHQGILCSMASFKHHCAFMFWKSGLVVGPRGNFRRITSMKDLPPKRVLLGYIKKAAKLNEDGIQKPRPSAPRDPKRALLVPAYFNAALKQNKKALAAFDAFPYSKKKEYVEWITGAKTDATRLRRLQTSVEWLAQGKSRNWKYQ